MSAHLRGSVLMVLAMAFFAIEDALLKSVMQQLPVGEVLILFGSGGLLVFMGLAMARSEQILDTRMFSKTLALRSVSEVAGRLFYTIAIALTPLSSASAILQATPLVVALGAVVFFGERVGPKRWFAISIGFLGVLLILRPGIEGFEPASIFAVLGTLGFAGRDLATRAAPPHMSNNQLGVYGFLMLVIAGIIALAYTGGATWPDVTVSMQLAAAIVIGVTAYNALTGAMRSGDVSIVAPFRYTRLIFGVLLGVTVFAERPDMLTIVGSVIIAVSGLYTLICKRT
ncbi:EamA family transporter [Cohaesibacter celericrescens]|uniref:EamA family transporter n=2 Tax=Cohaesibacter celericrescens TaxID=2067669 RepID=A0A2N5XL49_9HYPH|nr:EamA family transporter [Cohaesibacter celericrescens]